MTEGWDKDNEATNISLLATEDEIHGDSAVSKPIKTKGD